MNTKTKAFTVHLDEVDEYSLIRAVKKKRCLMSREIDVQLDNTNLSGSIYAGMRTVGSFTIE